jgi:hypothetical protein
MPAPFQQVRGTRRCRWSTWLSVPSNCLGVGGDLGELGGGGECNILLPPNPLNITTQRSPGTGAGSRSRSPGRVRPRPSAGPLSACVSPCVRTPRAVREPRISVRYSGLATASAFRPPRQPRRATQSYLPRSPKHGIELLTRRQSADRVRIDMPHDAMREPPGNVFVYYEYTIAYPSGPK